MVNFITPPLAHTFIAMQRTTIYNFPSIFNEASPLAAAADLRKFPLLFLHLWIAYHRCVVVDVVVVPI
jgi:hypothetical protein